MKLLEGVRFWIALRAALAFASAFAVTTLFVWITIRVCRSRGWVSKPRADRWHRGTPAFFGGVPLFVGFAALIVFFVPWSSHLLWRLVGTASLMFLLGLADDVYHLAPSKKFVGQLLAAGVIISSGLIYPWRESVAINVAVSLVWLVGITNAFNLLDNMDGLSSGIALISAGYLAVFYVGGGYRDQAVIVALAAGAIAGFLVFNFNPARIFMGDSGSLFLGFLLGAASLLEVTHVSGVPALVFAPVTVLAIPVFDTFFVSVTRRLRGQAISQGGTDHSSHRLVRMGLAERRAVLVLYALSAGSGAVALLARHLSPAHTPGLIGLWFFFLLLFGVHLFQDELTQVQHSSDAGALFLKRLRSRDTLIVLLDPLAMVLSYYLAYTLRFRAQVSAGDRALLLGSMPIVVASKFFSLWTCRAFRHSWWRGSVSDIYRLGAAALIGEMLSIVFLTGLYRFNGFSRTVFAYDFLITWILLLAVRRSFPLFRDTIYSCRAGTDARHRVFILGTSDQAELALRFLRDQRIECAGFIDTNGGADLSRYIFGRPVLGRLDDLGWLSRRHGVFEVVLPDREESLSPNIDFQSVCQHRQLRLIKLGLYDQNARRDTASA